MRPPRLRHWTEWIDLEGVVYRVYDANDRLLYIGCTSGLKQRLEKHKYATPWWKEVDHLEFDGPLHLWLAAAVEKHQIAALAPVYNRLGNPRRGWRGRGSARYCPELDEFAEAVTA